MKLLLDYETRSRADLPAVGQHMYARHESTEILCVGWKIIGEKTAHVISYPAVYTNDESETKEFYYALKHAEHVVAHNAPFEQAIYKHVHTQTTPMGPHMRELTPEDYICTASMGAVLALPRSLENIGNALNLEIKKDVTAKKLLMSMCKPRRPIQNIKAWLEWVEDDEALKKLYEYCRTDLWTEEKLYEKLKPYRPFTKKERDVWVLDQKINQRGFRIDYEFCQSALNLIKSEETELNKDLHLKTFGWVKTAKQTKNFKEFLSSQGFEIENLQKKTVDDTLKAIETLGLPANQDVVDVLKIRQQLGKSSTSKYQAFIDRCDTLDFRVRDNLFYHGASTGRWAGSGVQPQNFPRGTMKVPPSAFREVSDTPELIRLMYRTPMDLLSSALRGAIVATPNKEMFCADFSSIEARVLLWLAEDMDGLKEYEAGLDTYCTMASTVYGIPYKEILDEYKREGFSEMRQVGKKVILACGYQMGKKKFLQTCIDEGLNLPESLIERAHDAFRVKYPLVPKLWNRYEQAAIFATINKGKKVTCNRVSWYVQGEFLFAELSSGRRLAYYKPEVRNEITPYGKMQPKLYHYSVNSLTKQWELRATYGGMLTENISQAVSRDCMAEAMLRVEDAGYEILITVHDEVLCERDKGTGTQQDFERLMSVRPDWAQDLPLKVGGWVGERYRK